MWAGPPAFAKAAAGNLRKTGRAKVGRPAQPFEINTTRIATSVVI
jgi:hypothetical protein